jgi:hypothetical protein
MFKRIALIICMAAVALAPALAQEKPALVVHPFTVASHVKFPYDMKELQVRTITMLKNKNAEQFGAISDAPSDPAAQYVLDGEVLDWHKGNTIERMALAMGSVAGRENAKIHFWLTDKDGKKVFESTDTIRQGFMNNTHEKNSGTLGDPFSEKLCERLKEASSKAAKVSL